MNFRASIIPATNDNRPGTLLSRFPTYITIHETANFGVGNGAEMHRKFTHNGGGPENVSFHFVVDDKEAIQLLPVTEIGWHAGDGCDEYPDGVGHDDTGCFSSVAIEMCVNSDGNFDQTMRNTATLIAKIIMSDEDVVGFFTMKNRFSENRIAQHNAWSGKDCPHTLRSEGLWNKFLGYVDEALAHRRGVTPAVQTFATPLPYPPYDGKDKSIGSTKWYAISRTVTAAERTRRLAWADNHAENAESSLKAGGTFESRYLVQNRAKQWWYISKEGWRILASKCVEQFKPTYK